MTYCVNPRCAQPQNSLERRDCQRCGCHLLLKGKYGAVKELGIGGFGRTFLAIDYSHPNKQRCVIKQLFPERQNTQNYSKTLELFQQEAQQLKYLGKHPQIPDCFESFGEGDYQYIIQEFVDGNDLNQQLKLSGLFTEAQIFNLLKEILPVLEFIHQKGIIHRDVKPANIIASQADGSLWLVDLGAAKQLTGAALAQTGTVIGSAEYTAPEQGRGKAIFASDIYSLGVTCIYLLTGVSPFNLYDTGDSRWVWRDFLPNNVSPTLGPLLDKMIQMSTNRRYRTVQDVQADLANINLEDSWNNQVEKTFGNPTTAPVAENQKSRFEKSHSSREQKYPIKLQQEKQPAQLKVSVGFLGELATAVTDELVSFLSENLFHRQTRVLFCLVSFSFIAFLIHTPKTIRHTQRNSANDSVASDVTATSSEDVSYESYLDTSADFQIETSLYPHEASFLAPIYQNQSKIGFQTIYTVPVGNSLATWALDASPLPKSSLTLLSSKDLKSLGFFESFLGDPLILDSNNQLKVLDILTGETSSILDQEMSFLDSLEVSSEKGRLVIDSTKSFAYYVELSSSNPTGLRVTVWDINSNVLLTTAEVEFLGSSLSQDSLMPFSSDGNWLLLPHDSNHGFQLWDLTSKSFVRHITADLVSFSSNKALLIVKNKGNRGEISDANLFDLSTQRYLLPSSDIKDLVLHPNQTIVAIFDGQKIALRDIENFDNGPDKYLGEYPTLRDLQFSPNGQVLAGRLENNKSSGVGELIFWDTATGKVLEGPQPIGGLNILGSHTLQFSPDGQTLLIHTDNGKPYSDGHNLSESTIKVWRVPQPLRR